MILCGVDEAGYGPLLGPLVVGTASFRVEGAKDARAAEGRVRAALSDPRQGVRIDDSKRIHRPAKGIGPLEREVLAVLAARDGKVPANGLELLAALGVLGPPVDHPWYGDLRARPLPEACDAGEALARGAALAGALERRAIRLQVEAEAVPEGRLNEAIARLGSKAAVLFEHATIGVFPLLEGEAGPVQVLFDRQGGRMRYGGMLRERFGDLYDRATLEGRAESRYLLRTRGGGPVSVGFRVGADGQAPEVGLASMAAKYVRELWMASLNRHVLREAPGVRPTAGYWTDGHRFLRETAAARKRLGLGERSLVRRA